MKMSKEPKRRYTQADEIESINAYLARGDGRGRLNSAAAVCNGLVGYFFVGRFSIGGKVQEAIYFSCTQPDGTNPDILITHFPAHPKYWERVDSGDMKKAKKKAAR